MRTAIRTNRLVLALLAAGSLGLLAPSGAAAQGSGAAAPPKEPALTEIGVWAGRYDAFEADPSNEVGVELRYRPFWQGTWPVTWRLAPAWGAMTTDRHAAFAYAGFRLEVPLGPHWRLVPQSGAGLYHQGDDKNLGGPVEFRSGIELDLRIGAAQELGLVYYHLSNAVLYDHNPGEESLVLVWTWRRGGR